MKEKVTIDRFGNLMDGRSMVLINSVGLTSGNHPDSNLAMANTALLADAINTERETGKTPSQLAREIKTLREQLKG